MIFVSCSSFYASGVEALVRCRLSSIGFSYEKYYEKWLYHRFTRWLQTQSNLPKVYLQPQWL